MLIEFAFIMLFIKFVPGLCPILSCNFLWENLIYSLWMFQNKRKYTVFFTNMTNKMQLCRIIYYSLTAVQISSDIFAHH
jgi:hypothetical protein